MLRNFVKVFYGVSLSLCLLLPAALQADENLSAAERLTSILSATDTLEARVEQLTLDQQGREVQASQATLRMRKPDQFYWHATEPWEEVLVTDGETLWIHEPDLEQVTIETFNDATSHTPAMLLSADAGTLARDFDITITEMQGNRIRFRLVPRQPEALFEELYLGFEGRQLAEMQFTDSLGQRTSLVFRDVVMNPTLPDSAFVFEIPEDVEVIDARRR